APNAGAGPGLELQKSDRTAAGTLPLKDIVDVATSPTSSNLNSVNGTMLFTATLTPFGSGNVELWKSDGTAAGTVMVKDIFAGTQSSSPSNLVNVNGTLYFTANNGTNGIELWKSDGTTAGTVMVKDIFAGAGSS